MWCVYNYSIFHLEQGVKWGVRLPGWSLLAYYEKECHNILFFECLLISSNRPTFVKMCLYSVMVSGVYCGGDTSLTCCFWNWHVMVYCRETVMVLTLFFFTECLCFVKSLAPTLRQQWRPADIQNRSGR